MQLLTSIKIGLVPINADLSNGRLHILSTPETIIRDAFVTILAMVLMTAHKQILKNNPKRKSSLNKKNNQKKRNSPKKKKNLKKSKNRKRNKNWKRKNNLKRKNKKRATMSPNLQTSVILLKNLKRFGKILTSQIINHPGPCTK